MKTEELDKTENSMIFIERDSALSKVEIDDKLAMLKEAWNVWRSICGVRLKFFQDILLQR